MRRGQAGGELARNVEELRCFQRPAADPLRKRLPLAILHDDEREAVAFTDFVDRSHVRVADCRGVARLAEKTGPPVRRLQPLRMENLQRYGALQTRIAGQVNRSHPALSENPENLKAIER